MHIRTTTAAVLAVAALALTACGSSDDSGDSGGDKAGEPATSTSATASASAETSTEPELSEDELKAQCSDAVAAAAPGWDDWNIDLGNWQNDPRTPEICKGLANEEFPPRGNRAFQDALIDGLEIADDPRASH